MSVDDHELDVFRFETMLHSAQKACGSGSWEAAAGYAASALALWRGEPLADVESAALTLRESSRLSELRLQAIETKAEADLRLGRNGEVIADMERLAAVHPFREHLRALLMRAVP